MWKRILLETSIVAVQTVALIGLCATVGISRSDPKAEANSGWPLPYPTELVRERSVKLDIHPDGRQILYTEGTYFWQFWSMRNLPLGGQEQAAE